jgi:hypothetical protein
VRELSDGKALEKAIDTEVWRTITRAAPTTTTNLTRQKIRIRDQEKETTVIVFLTLDPNLQIFLLFLTLTTLSVYNLATTSTLRYMLALSCALYPCAPALIFSLKGYSLHAIR